MRTIAVTLAASAVLMGTGTAVAMADPAPKVKVCHATGSETNPFVLIEISENALDAHFSDKHQRGEDVIGDGAGAACAGTTPTPDPEPTTTAPDPEPTTTAPEPTPSTTTPADPEPTTTAPEPTPSTTTPEPSTPAPTGTTAAPEPTPSTPADPEPTTTAPEPTDTTTPPVVIKDPPPIPEDDVYEEVNKALVCTDDSGVYYIVYTVLYVTPYVLDTETMRWVLDDEPSEIHEGWTYEMTDPALCGKDAPKPVVSKPVVKHTQKPASAKPAVAVDKPIEKSSDQPSSAPVKALAYTGVSNLGTYYVAVALLIAIGLSLIWASKKGSRKH